jgi:2-polyprenyl-6-methoxyphenol hydroxylase-like FAD-dependent oxidoreductase
MDDTQILTPVNAQTSLAAAPAEAMTSDVVIIGGGLAGSLTGAMLGRAGIDCIVVEPHKEHPDEFRCEKLDGDQVRRLQKTGLADEILAATTPDIEAWVARRGMIVDKRRGDQHGTFYAPLVNRVRSLIPPSVRICHAKATSLSTSEDRQTVTLANGTTISARLAVLSNGLSVALRDQVGLGRQVLSPCHSISIGFNLMPTNGGQFACPAITYYAKSPVDRAALLTMFPIGDVHRVNLFVYRNMDDVWLRDFRAAPEKMLRALMPELESMIGPYAIEPRVQIRPVDIFVSTGHVQPGLVLIGDAYATTCPAAGNGARKAITDAERLCNVYIPQWLATPGMGVGKISEFYSDPVKVACDRFSFDKAFALRSYSIDASLPWRMRRLVRFVLHVVVGLARRARSFKGERQVAPPTVPVLPEQRV